MKKKTNCKIAEMSHFDSIANIYDADFQDYPSQDYIKNVVEHLENNVSDGLVLEIGAGTGTFTCTLRKQDNLVISSDFSKEMIARAKSKNENIDHIIYLQCDGEKLPFKNGIFDQVICIGLLHHMIFLPNSYFNCLDEITRVLKMHGDAIIIEPNLGNIFQKLSYYTLLKRNSTSSREKPIHIPEITKELDDRNLKVELVETFTFLPRMTPHIIYRHTLSLQKKILKVFRYCGRVFIIKATKVGTS